MNKRKLILKLLSLATSAALAVSLVTGVSASAEETYPKNYTIENALTDFQYFVKGNCTLSTHCVGGIAVGGTANTASIGDGMVYPSYINTIGSSGVTLGTGNYTTVPKTIYYGTNSTSGDLSDKFVQNADYMDMTSAFTAIESQSTTMATSSVYTATSDDIITNLGNAYGANTLNIDVTKGSVLIPWDLYSTIDVINLINYPNADYFKTNPISISVSGVPSSSTVTLNFKYGTSGKNGTVNIFWNGTSADNYLFSNLSGKGASGNSSAEINLQGMKLLWNFPDAEIINTMALGGHLVAPKANVTVTDGGRFEGGIIANNFLGDNGSEAHYYPYNTVTEVASTTTSFSLTKTYATNAGDTTLAAGTKFKLYSDAACTTQVGTEVTAAFADGTTTATFSNIAYNSTTGSTFYIKESATPTGYTLDTTAYKVNVTATGTVTFNTSDTTLTIDNTAVTADSIQLIKTYADTDLSTMDSTARDTLLNGTAFTLYKTINPTTKALSDAVGSAKSPTWDKVNNRAIVTFDSDLAASTTYYLKETAAPTGYTASDNIYVCAVDENGDVTYKIYGSADTASTNFPTCDNVKTTTVTITTDVEFTKVSSANPPVALEGARFGLYEDESCQTPVLVNGTHYTVSSDNSGIVHFNNLTQGTYYFKELTAPTGYVLLNKIYSVTITIKNGIGSATFGDGSSTGLTQLSVPNDPIKPNTPNSGGTPNIPDSPKGDNPNNNPANSTSADEESDTSENNDVSSGAGIEAIENAMEINTQNPPYATAIIILAISAVTVLVLRKRRSK